MFLLNGNIPSANDSVENNWFKLTDIQHIRGSEGKWELERQTAGSHLLIVAAGGQGELFIDYESCSLSSELVWMCLPGQHVKAAVSSFEKSGVYLLAFDMGYSSAAMSTSGDEQQALCSFPIVGNAAVSAASIIPLCKSVFEYWSQEDKLMRLRSQAVFYELLYLMLQGLDSAKENNLSDRIKRAKVYLEQHCQEAISFEKLADEVGISSRHFRRLFKSQFGKSAVDYLTELRMNHAKQLMAKPDIQLWEVAQGVGFNDESHFRRAFKGHVGISPALYLKNRQLKVAAYSWPNIGMLLPLQIIPFAAPIDHYWTDYYRIKYEVDVTVKLRHDYDFNRKSLYLARPDRIIAIDEFLPAREQEMLSHIAPVLYIPWLSTDWREHLRLTAAFLEKGPEAAAWLADFDKNHKLKSQKLQHLVQHEKLLVVMIDRKNVYRWGRSCEGTALFHDFPLMPIRHLEHVELGFEPITSQQLSKLEADRIIVMISEDGSSQATWQTILQSEAWQLRGAVQAKRVHLIWLGPWYEYSAFNHNLILNQTLKILEQINI